MTLTSRGCTLFFLLILAPGFAGCGDRTPPEWSAGAALEAPEVSSDALWLTWPEAADEMGVVAYEVQVDGAVVAEPGPTEERRLLVESLTEFTDVSIAVTARDEAGNVSEPLSTVFRTLDVTHPVGTEGCEVTGTETVVDEKVTAVSLTWCTATDNDRLDRFEVRHGTEEAVVLGPDVLAHEVTGESLTSSYRVVACDPSDNCGTLGSYYLQEPMRLARVEMARKIAESAGILAALSEINTDSLFGSSGFSDDIFSDMDAIGGLIGAQGVTIGSGGLGSRGSGLGGGGTGEGLGGLGTRGGGGAVAGIGGLGTRGNYTPPSAKLSSGGDSGPQRDHVSRRLGRIETCFKNRLRDQSGLSGTLTISLAADAEGAVSVEGVGGVDDAELVRCSSTALRGRLAEPPGEPLTGAFGVTLTPGSSG